MSNAKLSADLKNIILTLDPDITDVELDNYYDEFIKDSAIFMKIIEEYPNIKYSAFFIFHFLGYLKKDIDNQYKKKYDKLVSIINEK